jgi:glucose/arabinose dehydrogenase
MVPPMAHLLSHRRLLTRAAILMALGATLSAVQPAAARDAVQLEFQGTIGGPGHAQMYPSGMEISPDGSIVVADTGNHQIAKFASNGTQLWRVGGFGTGEGGFDHPRDVAVDDQGHVFVADTGNTRVVELSSSGGWITSWKGPTNDRMGTPMGLSISDDTIYLADAGKQKVRVFSLAGVQQRVMSSNGSCIFSQVRDADGDADGNVYVANYTRNDVLKLSPTGTCLTKWGAKGSADGQFKNPYGVRIAFDAALGTQAVYVADSNNNRIQEFRLNGSFVSKFGSLGDPDQPGTMQGLRRVAVAPDGDVWAADMWGWRVERWDHTGGGYTYAQTIGTAPPPLDDGAVFNEVRGLDWDASGTMFAVDTVNERIVRISSSGHVVGACGERGWTPGEFNWPRGAAIDDQTGDVWVADTKQSRLQVVHPDCSGGIVVGAIGSGLGQFNWPNSVAIRQTDRVAFVADTNNNRVVAYNVATKNPIGSYNGLNDPRGIDVDPVTGHIFVADTENDRVVELSATSGGSFSFVRSLTAGFNAPEGVASDGLGHVFVADTQNSRLVVLSAGGSVDQVVTAPDGFDLPAEVAVGPDGRVYVADTQRDRIQVYAYPTAPPGDVTATRVITAANPAAFAFAPDGSLIYGERATGKIHLTAPNLTGDHVAWTVSGVISSGDQGLVGIAVPPTFPVNPYIYASVVRTVSGQPKLQLLKIKVSNGNGVSQSSVFATKAAPQNDGGRIAFGPDGKLYMATGEIGTPNIAQNFADPHGKVLRMEPSGKPAVGNPVSSSRVFAWGFRDPTGFAFDPATGSLWGIDDGPSCNDEVNVVTSNANYGWGLGGTCATPPPAPTNTNQSGANPVPPVWWWGNAVAPAGDAFCAGCNLGAEVDGTLLVSTASTNGVRALTLNGQRDGVASEDTIYTHGAPISGMERGPGGTVYVSDATGIWRLELS